MIIHVKRKIQNESHHHVFQELTIGVDSGIVFAPYVSHIFENDICCKQQVNTCCRRFKINLFTR